MLMLLLRLLLVHTAVVIVVVNITVIRIIIISLNKLSSLSLIIFYRKLMITTMIGPYSSYYV